MIETSVLFRGERRDVKYNHDWENGQCWVEEWWFTETFNYDDITEAETESIDAELLKHLIGYNRGD